MRDARLARGWTQAHLAQSCALSERTVGRAEAGGPLQAETALALCSVLDLDVAAFRTSNEGRTVSTPSDGPEGVEIMAALASEARARSPEGTTFASDVAAWSATGPHATALGAADRRCRIALEDFVGDRGRTFATLFVTVASVAWILGATVVVARAFLAGPSVRGVACSVAAVAVAFAGWRFASVVDRWTRPSNGDLEALKLAHEDRAKLVASARDRDRSSRTLYSVGPDGVLACSLEDGAVVSRLHPASLVTDVHVKEEGSGHATVEVVSLGSRLTMAWLPVGVALDHAVSCLKSRSSPTGAT